ncbi:LCP family protein [Streptomyces sp. TLI_146]|uniref:LCP family protein n=1 Tax=Streptomyces sp. TLI_146 TaxID=1938858 RepID=UPI000C7085FE|nr:LCP family protein [Streptomyces sp. TLI_146]PKV86087.1 LytR family transcriptional attenuator [Streptomyces sp. TLI_146]
MDADVTDSPPPAPDHRAEDEPRPDTPTPPSPPEPAGPTEAGPTEAETPEAKATEADATKTKAPEAKTAEAETPEAETPGERPGAPAPADGGSDAPGDGNTRRHWVRWTALGVSFLVLAAAGTGWWFYKKLDNNIRTDTTAAAELERYEKERPPPGADNAQNLLLIGSDSRAGSNSRYGRDDGGSQRSDTTILLHLAADRKSATAVSLPRDLMADVPDCLKQDGTRSKAQLVQFNSAFEYGGAACTIRTVEKLTGIRVDHHMVVDFSGFKDMVDAVDGVEVCLKQPVDDRQAHLKLPAGRQTLHGEEALGFVRARHGFGDGSDTERMDRQQQFLGSLVRKVQSNGVLLNPTRLYPVLDAMTKSLTTDPGLNSLKDLYDLVRGMRGIPTDKVQFLTVPRRPYTYDANRDELVQPAARLLFQQLRDDRPLQVAPAGTTEQNKGDGNARTGTPEGADGSSADDKPDDPVSPSPAPTYPGSNAAVGMCG